MYRRFARGSDRPIGTPLQDLAFEHPVLTVKSITDRPLFPSTSLIGLAR
jgi:hypothetical protein